VWRGIPGHVGLVRDTYSDAAPHCQVSQKRFDLGLDGEAVCAGLHAVEMDELYDPLYIGTLGVYGVAVETEHLADVIEELWGLTSGRVKHIRFPSGRPEIVSNRWWVNMISSC
jgi:hypothetical protein